MVISDLLRKTFSDEFLLANKQEIISFLINGETFAENVASQRRQTGNTQLDGETGLLRQIMNGYIWIARDPSIQRAFIFYFIAEVPVDDGNKQGIQIVSVTGEYK